MPCTLGPPRLNYKLFICTTAAAVCGVCLSVVALQLCNGGKPNGLPKMSSGASQQMGGQSGPASLVMDLPTAVLVESDEHQIVDAVLQPQLPSQSHLHH